MLPSLSPNRIGNSAWTEAVLDGHESLFDKGHHAHIERRASLFRENSVFAETNPKIDVGNRRNSDSDIRPDKRSNRDLSPLEIPERGRVSISTVFVAIFLFFVSILGASLMTVSIIYSADSNALLMQGNDDAQATYMALLTESNSRLIDASNYSVHELTKLISQQVNERVQSAVTSYTGSCQFSITQMAEMLESGELDEADMDFTLKRLWRLYGDFPSVSSLIVAGAKTGNWIVLLRNMVGLENNIIVRNTSGTTCRACLPGASNLSHIYLVPNMSRPMEWSWTGAAIPVDPRSRPWYRAGLAGGGEGRWTDPYTFDEQGNIGITAARMARDPAGGAMGVVGSDLTLADMSAFLRLLKSQVDIAYGDPNASAADKGFQMVLVHERGSLLATSTDDPLSRGGKQLAWSDAIRTPSLRAALEAVSAAVGGDWARLFAPGAPELRTYPAPGADTLVTTRQYADAWGLRLVLLSVVPVAMYTGQVDAEAAANVARIRADADRVAAAVAALRGRAGDNVRRNWGTQLGLSVGILAAGSLLVLALARRVARILRQLAAEMERVARLDLADAGSSRAWHVAEVAALRRSFALMDMSLLSFSRYVPVSVVRLLAHKGTVAHLGVAPRDVSVMFSDIVGFSSLAESLDPARLIAVLAQYLEAMSASVEDGGGTVGKFIGDAIMAFWNSPGRVEAHASAACACALRQQRRLAELREGWAAEGLPEVRMRLGLSCGTVLHGNVGSHRRMEWTCAPKLPDGRGSNGRARGRGGAPSGLRVLSRGGGYRTHLLASLP